MLENATPISVSQLLSCLKESDVDVDLFDTTFYRWGKRSDAENRIEALQIRPFPLDQFLNSDVYKDFEHKISEFQPDLIGFSVVEPTFKFGMRLLESAREVIISEGIKIAVGGVHAVMAPETIINYDLVDFICISEGEIAFPELCSRLDTGKDATDVQGFWVKKNGRWIKNQKAMITDLNKLPPLDFSLFHSSFLRKPMMGRMYNTISIEMTRGCPYRCSYCGDHGLRNLFKELGPWYREKKMELIFQELDSYIKNYKAEFIYIMSESFTTGKTKRLREFCERYKKYALPFWFNTRPDDITEEKAKLVKDAGCKRISIGLESGNEEFRRKILKRHGTNNMILKAGEILHHYDLSFSVNVIIGFPDETREMIFESIELCRQLRPDGVSIHIYNPYHGTELRKICVENGYIDKNLIAEDFFQADYILKGSTLSKSEILGIFRTTPLYVEMPKKEYKRIEAAEKFTAEGNRIFEELKKDFYQIKGWQ